jgi:metal-dependent HD superfamily phosphatase/phosphodiesterase
MICVHARHVELHGTHLSAELADGILPLIFRDQEQDAANCVDYLIHEDQLRL